MNTKFMGYRRPDGKVGIRNHVVVMAGVLCSDVAARRVVEACKGATFVYNPKGCGQARSDSVQTAETLMGLICNPNVYGALIIGLGCEGAQEPLYRAVADRRAPYKQVHYISMQKCGGLQKTIEEGVKIVNKMLREAAVMQREECDLSELMLGLECGGSDPTSGVAANAVLGKVSDMIVDAGGTTVISETSEAIGAEEIMRSRGATPEIGQAIYDTIMWKDNEFFSRTGSDIRNSNPSPGNIRAGLTTLEEKSLGCINKSGTRPFQACVKAAQAVETKGAVFMESAAVDFVSTTVEIAGGCQIVAFTTGMGNPMGNPVAPVLKITGNKHTYEFLNDIIDFDASRCISGEKTIDELADEMLEEIIEICNGKPTLAETNGANVVDVDQYIMGP